MGRAGRRAPDAMKRDERELTSCLPDTVSPRGARDRSLTLKVLAGAAPLLATFRRTRGQPATTHLLEAGARLRVLRPERGLDAVEQPFEPTDQLRLRQTDLGLARLGVERQGERLELLLQIFRQAFLQRRQRLVVDRAQTLTAAFVGRRFAHFFQELADHRGDSQELRRLRDELAAGLAVRRHENFGLFVGHGWSPARRLETFGLSVPRRPRGDLRYHASGAKRGAREDC